MKTQQRSQFVRGRSSEVSSLGATPFDDYGGILRRMSVGMETDRTVRYAHAVVEPVRVQASIASIITAFCAGRFPAILETTLAPSGGGGFSVFACDPVDEFVHQSGDVRCPFERLAAQLDHLSDIMPINCHLPFVGGWIGYFTYEAGLSVERIPTRKQAQRVLPAAHWFLYDAAAVYDHGAKTWYAVAVEWPESTEVSRVPAREKLDRVRARLLSAVENPRGSARDSGPSAREISCSFNRQCTGPLPDGRGTVGRGSDTPVENRCHMKAPLPYGRGSDQIDSPTPGAPGVGHPFGCEKGFSHQRMVGGAHPTYDDAFAKAMRYIEAGDVYQVNLTQRYEVETAAPPLDTYLRLRKISPSPYAAFLPWDEGAVICASPELFLELRDGRVVTRPIKGTRGRGAHAAEDATRRAELETSEKDRAELNMIIDLLRNDLGRVSRYGTVRVLEAGLIEEHPTVFQRVATVMSELRDGVGVAELLRATMPGGSVTGCPKIRAMQIIDELEPHTREVYCGAVGVMGLDGTMTLNLAIRTMLQRGNTVFVYAGGAVVADSTAEGEYREIETKAAAMLGALGVE